MGFAQLLFLLWSSSAFRVPQLTIERRSAHPIQQRHVVRQDDGHEPHEEAPLEVQAEIGRGSYGVVCSGQLRGVDVVAKRPWSLSELEASALPTGDDATDGAAYLLERSLHYWEVLTV